MARIRQFLVPTDTPGVNVEPQTSVDLVKRYARVSFDGVQVDASAAVGTAAQTPALIERQSQIAMVLQCAEVVGILDTVLDFTIQWAFDRYSFGRPLVSYQALKHRFADLKIWLEACRATTRAAVTEVAKRSPGADMAVSVAKSYVGERAPGCCRTASNCMAASASRGSTTCTCSCGESRCTARCSAHPRSTTCVCTR